MTIKSNSREVSYLCKKTQKNVKMTTNNSDTGLREKRNQLMEKATSAYTKGEWETALKFLKEAKKYDYQDSHIATDWLIAKCYEHLNNLTMADVYNIKADRDTNHPYKFQKEFYSRHKLYRPIKRLFVTITTKINDYRLKRYAKKFSNDLLNNQQNINP